MIIDIAKFNYLRNHLELNRNLEETMLIEEETEFIDAFKLYLKLVYEETDVGFSMKEEAILDILTDMVDAYCDFMYVYYGSLLKYLGTGEVYDKTQKQTLLSTILMEVLVGHGCKIHKQNEKPLLDLAMSYVIKANDAKTLDKTEGKVEKGDKFIDPKEKIKNLIVDRGFKADIDKVLEDIIDKLHKATKKQEPVDIADI